LIIMGSAPWYTTQAKVAEYLLSRSKYGGVSLRELEMFLKMHRPKTLRTIHHFERLGLVRTYLKGRRRHVDVNREKLQSYHRRLIRKVTYRQEKKEAIADFGRKISKKEFKEWQEKWAGMVPNLAMLLSEIKERKPDSDLETEKYLGLDACRDELRTTYKIFEHIDSHEKSKELFRRWVKELERIAIRNRESIEAAILTNLRNLRTKKTNTQTRRLAATYLTTAPMARKVLLSIALVGKQHREIREDC